MQRLVNKRILLGVTGGIGIDLKNWVKKKDAQGNTVLDDSGEPVLEEVYSVATGTVLTINTKTQKLYDASGKNELMDISAALTPQKKEFIRAGGSYAVVFGKKLQSFAATKLGIDTPLVFAPSKEVTREGEGLTAVERIFNADANLFAEHPEIVKRLAAERDRIIAAEGSR